MTLVQLETVDFDHTALSASNDALSIRINGAQSASGWKAGGGGTSYAAFALLPTLNQSLTISATFTFDPALVSPAPAVKIRARPADGTTSVLGSVESTTVVVPAGAGAVTTAAVSLRLSNVGIWREGIGRYEVSWVWQVQLKPKGAWIDFERSRHTIFVTLDVPTAPWTQLDDAPHRVLWPWTEVLDHACVWAKGITLTSTNRPRRRLSGCARRASALQPWQA